MGTEKKIKILLADDNKSDLKLALFALEDLNIDAKIDYAKDGADLLSLLFPGDQTEAYVLPDLILLDLELPKVHGLELLTIIRNNEKTDMIPIIILSSTESEESIRQSYAHGANCFIQKPIDFFEFGRVLEGIIRFWVHG
ncbi:MAG: response regulator [Bacteroidia bacterium]